MPWTHSQAGESITVQKLNNPQGGQVHYTDAAAGASNDRGRSLALYVFFLFYSQRSSSMQKMLFGHYLTL